MSKIPLKPQNETFTDTQWQAIFDKGIISSFPLQRVQAKPPFWFGE